MTVKGLSQSAAETVVRKAPSRAIHVSSAISLNAPASRPRSSLDWPRLMRSARSVSHAGRPTGCRWPMAPREPLFANLADENPPPLPELSPAQEVIHDYHAQGLSLRGHPFAPLREYLKATACRHGVRAAELKAGRRYRVAGLVLLRQRPATAKGITFMTLEDETGTRI